MTVPNHRNWSAWEDRRPPVEPKATSLYVTGEVETNNGAIQPVLRKANPQGINPAILILDLTLEKVGDVGTADVNYRDVQYDRPVVQDEHSSVEIRWEGSAIETIKVDIVH